MSVVGLGAAVDYVAGIGWEDILRHENELLAAALDRFAALPPVSVYGPGAEHRSGVVAFTVDGVHPHDIASLLAEEGIGTRAGHHCAQPLHNKLGVPATARISFGVYSEEHDLNRFFSALEEKVLPLAQ